MRSRCSSGEERSGSSGDSCYYPQCRKDANCSCKMCLASINATLDLRPNTHQKSSITRLSTTSRPHQLQQTPISFHLSTPTSNPVPHRVEVLTPALTKSTPAIRGRDHHISGWFIWRLALGLSLIAAFGTGYSFLISQILRPVLTGEMVKSFAERCLSIDAGLNGRLRLLEEELKRSAAVVKNDGQVLNCSETDSSWKIHQEGLLLHSSCALYSSSVEEVRVWGWPLHTAGLLTAGFSSRSFTILSGRMTQWSNGKMGFSALKENSSTVQSKWSANIVQMDPNTWVLEYKRSSMLESSRLFSAVLELFKYAVLGSVSRMSEGLWRFENRFAGFQADDEGGHYFKFPT